jgi:hypothetical protein
VSISVLVSDDVPKQKIGLDHHPISVEVMFQLLRCNQDDIDQLLNLRVPRFGLIEYLADEVNKVLDFVNMAEFLTLDHDDCRDHTISGRNIEEKDIVFLRSGKDWWRGKELF